MGNASVSGSVPAAHRTGPLTRRFARLAPSGHQGTLALIRAGCPASLRNVELAVLDLSEKRHPRTALEDQRRTVLVLGVPDPELAQGQRGDLDATTVVGAPGTLLPGDVGTQTWSEPWTQACCTLLARANPAYCSIVTPTALEPWAQTTGLRFDTVSRGREEPATPLLESPARQACRDDGNLAPAGWAGNSNFSAGST